MAYYVCDISALRFWRNPHSAERLALPRCSELDDSQGRVSIAMARGETWPEWFGLPVHVMVDSEGKRSRAANVRVHVRRAPIRAGSFVRVNNELCVAAPEASFLQASYRMGFAELVMLGFELCGTYRLREASPGFVEAARLCTPEQLAAPLPTSGKAALAARRAARHVIPGAASPMEAAVAMLMCLPFRRGGYGLEHPLMNARPVAALPYVCDFYWPRAHLVVEYDSEAFHSSGERLERDSLRRAALEEQGIRVISLTRSQVFDPGEFERVVRIVSAALGRAIKIRCKSWPAARDALRETVLPGGSG